MASPDVAAGASQIHGASQRPASFAGVKRYPAASTPSAVTLGVIPVFMTGPRGSGCSCATAAEAARSRSACHPFLISFQDLKPRRRQADSSGERTARAQAKRIRNATACSLGQCCCDPIYSPSSASFHFSGSCEPSGSTRAIMRCSSRRDGVSTLMRRAKFPNQPPMRTVTPSCAEIPPTVTSNGTASPIGAPAGTQAFTCVTPA